MTAQIINQPELFGEAADAVLESGACDALAIFLTTIAHSPRLRGPLMQVFTALRQKHPESVLAVCMRAPEEVKRDLAALGYVQIDEPSRLIGVLAALADIRQHLEAGAIPAMAATADLRLSLPAMGRISEHDAKALLGGAGLPFAREHLVRTSGEAAQTATVIGFPVVLKLVSPDVTHKSEIGGVMLGLADEAAVKAAFDTILANAAAKAPDATVDGVLVGEMVTGGHEMIVGGHVDEVAGPLVTVGAGGIYAEILRDVATACAPVGMDDAMRLIGRLQIGRILKGARGLPPAGLSALANVVLRVSQLIAANADQIEALEINPLIVRADRLGAVGVDAVIIPKHRPRPA